MSQINETAKIKCEEDLKKVTGGDDQPVTVSVGDSYVNNAYTEAIIIEAINGDVLSVKVSGVQVDKSTFAPRAYGGWGTSTRNISDLSGYHKCTILYDGTICLC